MKDHVILGWARRRRAFVWVIAVLPVLVATGCSGGSRTARPSSSTSPISTKAQAATLGRQMPTHAPSGFVLQPDSVGDTGPSDLAKAVRDESSKNARQLLTRDGFSAGFQRLWQSPSGDAQNILFLYKFRTAAGASAFERQKATTLPDARTGPRPAPFAVSGIPGATGFTLHDRAGSAAVIVFSKGVYSVMAVANSKSAVDLAGDVTALAQAQNSLL